MVFQLPLIRLWKLQHQGICPQWHHLHYHYAQFHYLWLHLRKIQGNIQFNVGQSKKRHLCHALLCFCRQLNDEFRQLNQQLPHLHFTFCPGNWHEWTPHCQLVSCQSVLHHRKPWLHHRATNFSRNPRYCSVDFHRSSSLRVRQQKWSFQSLRRDLSDRHCNHGCNLQEIQQEFR